MDRLQINRQLKTFRRGDSVELDSHGLTELATMTGTVTCVRSGKIYTDLLCAPFDQLTLMPLNLDGQPFAPNGRILLLRHTEDDYSRLPSIEVIKAMGLPNLDAWAAAIQHWHSTED